MEIFKKRTRCPVCHSSDYEAYFSLDHSNPNLRQFLKFERFYSSEFWHLLESGALDGFQYKPCRCVSCGMVFLEEVLTDRGMGELYNSWLDPLLLKDYYKSKPPYENGRIILNRINRFHKKKLLSEKPKLLDFGSGYGEFCRMGLDEGFDVYSYEIGDDKNVELERLGIKGINTLDGFENQFRFIWINQVMEHLAEPRRVLQALTKCLTTDGILYISTPNCTKLEKFLKSNQLTLELFKLLSPHQHVNGFTNRHIKVLGELCGLIGLSHIELARIFFVVGNPLNRKVQFRLVKIFKGSSIGTSLFLRKITA